MAWYPEAVKMELQPESDSQPAIRPTQLIFHSLAAPWTIRRVYEYWKTVSLESNFAVDYEGGVGQYIGTETRADANAGANRRADGTGAVSVETSSNLTHTDPWNDQQVRALIALGVWLHQRHGIPLRICRTHDDPGYGYHSMFPQWSLSGTGCPGAARISQFREEVFPGIVRAAGEVTEPEEDMTPEQSRQLAELHQALVQPTIPTRVNEGASGKSYTLGQHVSATNGWVADLKEEVALLRAALAGHDSQVDVSVLVARITAALEGLTFRLDAGTGA